MGQWIPVAGLVIAAVGVLVWWRATASDAPRRPAWRWARRPPSAKAAAPPQLRGLARQVLDGVLRLGERTGRDDAIALPHEVVLHVHPADLDPLTEGLAQVEQAVAAEIAASGEREGWVTAASLRIRDVVADSDIRRGHPLVQRAMTGGGGRRPRAPQRPAHAPAVTLGFVLVPLDGGDAPSLGVPAAGGRIGRDPNRCAIVVTGSTVSREHAELHPDPGGYLVCDLGSVNGLSVNGRATGRATLHDGDVLGLGRSVRLRLQRAEPHDDTAASHTVGGR